MTLLPIFIACVFTLFALWLMISPFLGGNEANLRLEHLDDEVREIELLVTRRAVLLTSLRELEFDRETAKLADDDYEKFRRRYEAEAVRIMRRLDELHGGKEWKAHVEAEVEERLGRPSKLKPAELEAEEADAAEAAEAAPDEPSIEEPSEPEEAPVADEASEPADDSGVEEEEEEEEEEPLAYVGRSECAGCGEPLEDDDKFCSQCGAAVAAAEAAAPAPNEASA